MPDKEREAFEAWGRAAGLEDKALERGMNYPLGDHLWLAWQARAALAAAPAEQAPVALTWDVEVPPEVAAWLSANPPKELRRINAGITGRRSGA